MMPIALDRAQKPVVLAVDPEICTQLI